MKRIFAYYVLILVAHLSSAQVHINSSFDFEGSNNYLYLTATAHYTLRCTNSVVTYVVRVRRSSDNAERDCRCSEITDGTLITWVGSNTGYLVTFYDQTGNGFHASNTTAAQQSKIINSGTLYTINSLPAVYLTSTLTNGYEASELNGNSDIGNASMFGVFKNNTTSNVNRAYGFGNYNIDGSTSRIHINISGDNSIRYDGASKAGSITATSSNKIRSTFKNSTTYNDHINGSSNISSHTFTDGGIIDDFYIGPLSTGLNTYFLESIIFLTDESVNRIEIETSLNNYYSFY